MFKSKPDSIKQYQKYRAAFEKKGTNKHKLSFNMEDFNDVEKANGKGVFNDNYLGYICCGSLSLFPEALTVRKYSFREFFNLL